MSSSEIAYSTYFDKHTDVRNMMKKVGLGILGRSVSLNDAVNTVSYINICFIRLFLTDNVVEKCCRKSLRIATNKLGLLCPISGCGVK